MPHLTIISHGDSAAVILPKAVLDAVGMCIGDTLDVTLGVQELILRPVADEQRLELMEKLTQEVLDRRSDAYQRLA